jgi:hypothetical protein
MQFAMIEGRPVYYHERNEAAEPPGLQSLDCVVVNEQTGERYLVEDGHVIRRLGFRTENIAPTSNCSGRQVLRPEFRGGSRSTGYGAAGQQTRQEPLVMPTMNWAADYTTNPFVEDDDDDDGQLLNTRELTGRQQEALPLPEMEF